MDPAVLIAQVTPEASINNHPAGGDDVRRN
jgi:hypothetical protein